MDFEIQFGISYYYVEVEIVNSSDWKIKSVHLSAEGLLVDTVDVTLNIGQYLKTKIEEKVMAYCCMNFDEANKEAKADRHNDDPDNR